MNVKRALRRVITGEVTTIKRTAVIAVLNYIINLEREIRRLSRSKAVSIEILVED